MSLLKIHFSQNFIACTFRKHLTTNFDLQLHYRTNLSKDKNNFLTFRIDCIISLDCHDIYVRVELLKVVTTDNVYVAYIYMDYMNHVLNKNFQYV